MQTRAAGAAAQEKGGAADSVVARLGNGFSAEVQLAVESYLRNNMAPIPVPRGTKNPGRDDWQTERWSIEDIPHRWSHGENVGILLGDPSDGLSDVDLDSPEAIAVAAYLLPDTRTSGRPGKPESHRYYRADPLPKGRSFKLPGKGSHRCVVELRTKGQTLVPPSLHPEGERYAWGRGTEIASIDGGVLWELVHDVATAALLLRNYPERGCRHSYVLAAAGLLGRQLEPERVRRIMHAVVAAAGDEEAEDRARDVSDTLEKIRLGSPATGGPTLDDLAPGVPAQLRRWHGWSSGKHAQPSSGGSSLMDKRIALAEAIKNGIVKPEEHEPGVLLRGRVHHIYAAAGLGKSWLGLHLAVQAIARGERVLFFDMENGLRIVVERLRALKVDLSRIDDLLCYIPSPDFTNTYSSSTEYVEWLDTFKPQLIVFDSWINFLAAAQLDENAAGDIASWAIAYTHPARARGITVVLLDHVSHAATHARGSTRKKDEADVQYRLSRPEPFDRSHIGEIVLTREKDREGWLPDSVRFEVGGDESVFIFCRSDGTSEPLGQDLPTNGVALTEKERAAFKALRAFGIQGARFNQWLEAAGVSRETLSNTAKKCLGSGLVLKDENRRYRVVADLGSNDSRDLSDRTRTEPNPGETVRSGSPPLRGEPTAPPHGPSERTSTDNLREEG
jgi:hypothetical protein